MNDRQPSPYGPNPPSPLAPITNPMAPTEAEMEDLHAEGRVLDGPGVLSMMAYSAAACFVKPKTGNHTKKIDVGDVMELSARQMEAIHRNFKEKDLEEAGRNIAGLAFNVLVLGAIIEQETGGDSHHGAFVSELDDLLSKEP